MQSLLTLLLPSFGGPMMFVSFLPVAGAVSFWPGPFCAAVVAPPVVHQKGFSRNLVQPTSHQPWMEGGQMLPPLISHCQPSCLG